MDSPSTTLGLTIDQALRDARLGSELAGLTRTARAKDYRALSRGVWVRRDSAPTVGGLAVAHSRAVAGAVITGWSAAALHGVSAPGHAAPELAVDEAFRARAGVTFRRTLLPESGIITYRDVRVVALPLAAFEVVRFGPSHLDDVLALERFARSGLDLDLVARLAGRRTGAWRARRVVAALADVDTRAQSPPETELRLLLSGAGLSGFEPQVEVPGLGYVLDLGHREARVGVEYDGAYHRSASEQVRGADRHNRLRSAGWTLIYVTWAQLRNRPDEVVLQVRQALREALDP